MQKKILITFLFKEGAGPVFTLEMSRGLAQNGCEIHALLSSKISNRKDWENEKSFKSVTFIETGTRKTAIQATLSFFFNEKYKLKRMFQKKHSIISSVHSIILGAQRYSNVLTQEKK